MNVTTQEAKTTYRWLTLRRAIAAAFTAALTVTGLLPLLGASAAGAATSVAGLVGPCASSSASGGTGVIYTVGFTTSSTGALAVNSGTVTISTPTGTTLPSLASDYTINVGPTFTSCTVNGGTGAVAATSVSTSNGGTTATITTPVAVANSQLVAVVINGVTNPPSGSYTFGLSTSSDLSSVTSSSYSIGSSVSAITGPTLSNAGAGQPSNYTIGFTTSASGSLVGGSGTIQLTAPTVTGGTQFVLPTAGANTAGSYFVNGIAAQKVTVNGEIVTITVPTIASVAASSTVSVLIENVTNTDLAGNYTFSVQTSSDQAPVTSPSYSIGTIVTLTSVKAPNGSTALGAGLTGQQWNVGFTTSASGALTSGTSTISFSAPAGTTLPTTASSYVVQSVAASTVNVSGTTVTITDPIAVGDGIAVVVSISGITDPSTPESATAYIATSSDTAPQPASFSFTTAVSNLTATTTNNYNTVTAPGYTEKGTYTVSFTATTGLAAGTGTISVCVPESATQFASGGPLVTGVANSVSIASGPTGAALDAGTPATVAVGVAPCATNFGGITVTVPAALNGGLGVSAGQTVTLVITGQTNPTATGNYPFQVLTSADTGTATTATPLSIVAQPASSVSAVTLTPSSLTAGGAAYYSGSFTTNVAIAAAGSVTVNFPAGTTIPAADTGAADACIGGVAENITITGDTVVIADAAGTAVGSTTIDVGVASGTSCTTILAGANAFLNPSAGNYTATVSTSQDATSVTTPPYTIGTTTTTPNQPVPTLVPVTTSASNMTVSTRTSGSGALSTSSVITLSSTDPTCPFPTTATDYVVDGVVAATVGAACGGAGTVASPFTITIDSPVAVGASSPLVIGIQNFVTPTAGTFDLGIVTTADAASGAAAITSQAYNTLTSLGNTAVTPGAITSPTSSAPGTAGSTSQYNFTFTVGTSMTPGTSTITISAPSGTVFPATATDYTIAGATESTSPTLVNSDSTAVILVPGTVASSSVATGSVVAIGIAGVTNPSVASTGNELAIFTSTDPIPVLTTGGYKIATGVSKITGPYPDVPVASGTNETYTVGFVATSGIATGNTIVITGPAGTNFTDATPADYTINGVGATAVAGSGTAAVTLTAAAGSATSPGGTVLVSLPGVTNPSTASLTNTFTVSTTADGASVTSSAYTIATGISTPTVALSSNVADSPAQYTIGFTVSATGSLAANTGTITAAFPSGTVLSTATTSYVVNGVTASSVSVSSTTAKITVANLVPASGSVSLAISGVTNTIPGTYNLVVNTSADTTPQASGAFSIVAPPAPTVSSIAPNTGATAGGTSVTITGSGFTSNATVTFGAVSATGVVVNSSTSITVPSPSQAAGVVNVEVSTIGGTSTAITADQFTYTAPVPTVSGISPSTGSTNGGTSVTVTGTGLTAATAVDFGSTPATGVTVKNDTTIIATSPAGAAGVVDVTVTTAGGTSAKSSADQFTYAVIPAPTVTAVSPNSGTTAGGQTITVTGTNLTGATAVDFGATAGTSVTVNSAGTSLTVVSPKGTAGAVDVTVTTAGGTSAKSSADTFTYSGCAIPTVTGISPNTGSTLGGTVVTVTGTGFEVAGSPATCVATSVDFGPAVGTSMTVNSATSITVTSPAGSGPQDVTVVNAAGSSATSSADQFAYVAPGNGGFFTLSAYGKVYDYGNAPTNLGDASNLNLNAPMVAMAVAPGGAGYWLLGADGGVFSYGTAVFEGSSGQINPALPAGGSNSFVPNKPIVGIVATSTGKGYWMVGSDGGVFAFGDATFVGSSGQINPALAAGGSNSFMPNKPIVGLVPTTDGRGYWMVAADGGIFAFGDAGFYGSSGQINPAQAAGGSNSFVPAAPIVGMIPSIDDKGYLMVGMDGGVYAFGDAPFYGSPAGSLSSPNSVTGIALTPDGKGYWVAGLDGSIYSFGDGTPTPTLETTPGPTSSSAIIAIASS